VVRPIDRADVPDFEPLEDAVPERFTRREIRVDVTDPGPVVLGGDSFTIGAGERTVRESVGVFLMARGRAEKVTE
jgi:DNA primase small subunit